MNYDGSRDGDQNGRPEAAGSEGPGAFVPIVLTAQPGKDLLISDGAWILGGQYSRQGSDFNDIITGTAARNMLFGEDGADTLTGGGGADWLDGGSGADVFKYLSEADSGVGLGLRDQIDGFEAGGDGSASVDTFDLTGLGSLSNFSFAGNDAAFTGSGDASARYDTTNHLLQIDTDGDSAADMEMEMTDLTGTLSTDDFVVS